LAECDPISRGGYAQLEISAKIFYNKFDCRLHDCPTQAANLWYDFSNPPKRSMQTTLASSSIGYLSERIFLFEMFIILSPKK
jgi:hypothetical protein